MDSYTKYLIIVTIVVTIVTIILFFIMYNYSDPVSEWPPRSNTCPDYWTKDYESGKGIVCYDTLRMSPDDDLGYTFTPIDPSSNGTAPTEVWGGIPLNGEAVTWAGTVLSPVQGYTRDDIETGFGSANQWSRHCGKRKWANDNGITWDGITNSNIDCSSYLGISGEYLNIWGISSI